jgi:hypothetical protein
VLIIIILDELMYIQLSRLGDVYCESFRFQVTPSIAFEKSTPYYDHDSHVKEVLVRNTRYEEPPIETFYLYDITQFLDNILLLLF